MAHGIGCGYHSAWGLGASGKKAAHARPWVRLGRL
jgi:hypothetical protein